MFKAPFSFNGRIRRMEYFLSFLVGGLIFGIAFFLGVGKLPCLGQPVIQVVASVSVC